MNKQNPHTESLKGKIDWSTAVIPFVLIAFLCISFMAAPDGSRQILDKIRVLLGDTFGLYYLVIGLDSISGRIASAWACSCSPFIWPFPGTAPSVWAAPMKNQNTQILPGAA